MIDNDELISLVVQKSEPDELDNQCTAVFNALSQSGVTSARERIAILEQCIDYLYLEQRNDRAKAGSSNRVGFRMDGVVQRSAGVDGAS